MMDLRTYLEELCRLDGVSGHEGPVRRYILDALARSSVPMDVTTDPMGNILVHLIGLQKAEKKVLLDAHMDEVGFLITHLNEDGTACFAPVGGIDKQVLFGHRVRCGKAVGIIGGKAVHHCSKEEKESVPEIDSMVIDFGVQDRDALKTVVSEGTPGTFAQELTVREDGFFFGKAVDDRMGCALLLELAQKQPPYDLWLSFSTQEEIGLRGAAVVGERVRPDSAVILDATTAADTVGSRPETAVCRVGDGPVISFADRSTLYDPDLYAQIRSVADQAGIPTQTKNRIAGGNNAGSIQRSGLGVRTAAMSLPCRYIHSPTCCGKLSDGYAMASLLRLLTEQLPA